jgi:hypothetical protein
MIHRLTPAFRDTRFPHVFAVEIPVDDSQYGASKTNLTPGSASPTDISPAKKVTNVVVKNATRRSGTS